MTSVLDAAAPIAERLPQASPCDYGPWETALKEVEPLGDDWPRFGRVHATSLKDDLVMFATDVSRPGWIEDHAHLTDFALTYLEADVMLFRSGYVKRHMLVRLRQARLSPGQIGRARRLVELAVLNGSGLEEFREYCRLAARLITRELQGWLEDTAREAMLTLDALDIDDWRRAQEAFDDKTFRKLHKGWFRHRRTWSFPANFTPQLVKTAELPHRNRVHVNAWRMLRQIERISQGTRP